MPQGHEEEPGGLGWHSHGLRKSNGAERPDDRRTECASALGT